MRRYLIVPMVLVAFGTSTAAASADTLAQAATATPTATSGKPTSTPVPCAVTPIGIQLILENPSPGDTLISGTQVVMNGVAYDTGATTGTGISSVVAYLGARDAGGLALGTAQLGQPNPLAAAGSQFANAGFTLRTPALPNGSGARSIFVYARSLTGNAEVSLEVPIFLNVAPTPVRGQVPTPVLPPPPACTPTPTTAPTVEATATPVTPPVATTPVAPTASGPALTSTPVSAVAKPAAATPATAATTAPTMEGTPAAVVAVAPTTAQTAPRGGGIPPLVGLGLLGLGAAIAAGGVALRRRERK